MKGEVKGKHEWGEREREEETLVGVVSFWVLQALLASIIGDLQ